MKITSKLITELRPIHTELFLNGNKIDHLYSYNINPKLGTLEISIKIMNDDIFEHVVNDGECLFVRSGKEIIEEVKRLECKSQKGEL